MKFAPMKPTPRGLWRRTPPAVFPPILGLLGLGLAARRAAGGGLAEAFLGAGVLLALFAVLAYAGKAARRPGVVLEDLRILPGRAGLAAAVLCLYLVALVLAPYGGGRAVLWGALAAHLALCVAMLRVFMTGPAEQRRVNPVWHLLFSGGCVGALAAQGLGQPGLALALFWPSLLAALAIWLVSLGQFARERVPAPLRPLLAVHLAPAAVLGQGALGFGADGLALALAGLGAVLLAALALHGRWLTEAGFTPLWGAMTFPLAATAAFWLALGWQLPGLLLLAAAALLALPVAFRVCKLWAGGQLAVKTGAAIA